MSDLIKNKGQIFHSASTAEFISIVTSLIPETFYHDIAHLQVMYRGHADSTWNALPAAFRTTDDFLNERLYLREFQRQLPEECLQSDLFDIVVKAQHYGIPTRLLDVTMNPLIALYFACESLHETDGSVLIWGPAAMFSQDDYTVKVIMEYLFNYKHADKWDSRYSSMLAQAVNRSDNKFFMSSPGRIDDILSKNTQLYIAPKLSNERIRAQFGAFTLFSTALEQDNILNTQQEKRFKHPAPDMFPNFAPSATIIIPAADKEKIIWELDCLGISKSTIFRGLEAHTVDMVERIRHHNKAITSRMVANKEK